MTLETRAAGFLILAGLLSGCAAPATVPAGVPILRLATTTSTHDSGLLGAILPAFEDSFGARVDVIAVGTGQALEIGKSGDVDVVLVHNQALEDAFVADGYGLGREPVMFNDFVLVGPTDDPADIAGADSAGQALTRIYNSESRFISRADDSGTYARELTLWEEAGVSPSLTDDWYYPIGQGMGETLFFAEEKQAYTLTDRATFLKLADDLPGLRIQFGGETIADNPDPALQNPYGVIQVTPQDPDSPQAALAWSFVEWITSLEAQTRISTFGADRFGQPLFYPASRVWCAQAGDAAPGCTTSP